LLSPLFFCSVRAARFSFFFPFATRDLTPAPPPKKNHTTKHPLPIQQKVMCASDAEHTAVVPLDVPAGCKPGDRVWFGAAYDKKPLAEINTKKSKLLELILKDCVTDAGECLCC
jgi:hypothetical protein